MSFEERIKAKAKTEVKIEIDMMEKTENRLWVKVDTVLAELVNYKIISKKMIVERLNALSDILEDVKSGTIKVLDNAICWEIETRKMFLGDVKRKP